MKRALCFLLSLPLCFALCAGVSADTEEPLFNGTRIACVGDSLTQGTCCSDESTMSYPAQLQGLADGKRYEVKNFGASGFAAMKNYNKGWSYWEHKNFQKSHDYQPSTVLLMLGTNDIIHSAFDTDYETDLTALIDSYKTLDSKPTVYVVTAPVAHDSRGSNLQSKLIPAQKKVAESTGCTLIDLNSETASWDKTTYYAPDGLHFNDAGYLKLAEFFYKELFKEDLYTLTVRAGEGIEVSVAGQAGPVIRTGNGQKTVQVKKGVTDFSFDITVKGNTMLDLGDATLDPGTSFIPTVTYQEEETTSQTPSTPSEGEDEDSVLWILLVVGGDLLLVAAIFVVVLARKKEKKA